MIDLDKMINPSNAQCERAFAIFKFLESRFQTIGLANALESTISKYNDLHTWLEDCDDQLLLLANRLLIFHLIFFISSNHRQQIL